MGGGGRFFVKADLWSYSPRSFLVVLGEYVMSVLVMDSMVVGRMPSIIELVLQES